MALAEVCALLSVSSLFLHRALFSEGLTFGHFGIVTVFTNFIVEFLSKTDTAYTIFSAVVLLTYCALPCAWLLQVLREQYGVRCMLGLTATATMTTAISVARHLGIVGDAAATIRGAPIPANLKLSVSSDGNREQVGGCA